MVCYDRQERWVNSGGQKNVPPECRINGSQVFCMRFKAELGEKAGPAAKSLRLTTDDYSRLSLEMSPRKLLKSDDAAHRVAWTLVVAALAGGIVTAAGRVCLQAFGVRLVKSWGADFD